MSVALKKIRLNENQAVTLSIQFNDRVYYITSQKLEDVLESYKKKEEQQSKQKALISELTQRLSVAETFTDELNYNITVRNKIEIWKEEIGRIIKELEECRKFYEGKKITGEIAPAPLLMAQQHLYHAIHGLDQSPRKGNLRVNKL